MGLFNPATITDQIILDLIANSEDLTGQYAAASADMVDAAGAVCLYEDQIPRDTNGYAKCSALQEYGAARACIKILRDFWGVAHGDADIYKDKLEYYIGTAPGLKQALTYEIILGQPRSPQPKAYMAPIW